MPEPNPDFGSAVAEVLTFLEVDAETAGPALGINARTLSAMTQGIIPLRSLIIRFAQGLKQRCDGVDGAPDWWGDPDAWLRLAGQGIRREAGEAPPRGAQPRRIDRWHVPPPGMERSAEADRGAGRATPGTGPSSPPHDPNGDDPARDHYHPCYERKPWGDSFVHIFWVLDREDRRVYQITYAASEDYRERASALKRDLQELEKFRFDRKYFRHRVNPNGQGPG